MSEQAKTPILRRLAQVIIGVAGVIFLGALGSGFWDIGMKPGLSWCGRMALTTLTLGSDSIRDSAYAQAAIDPTPIPSLLTLLFLNSVPVACLLSLFIYGTRPATRFFEWIKTKREIASSEDKSPEEKESAIQSVKQMITRLRLTSLVLAIGFSLIYLESFLRTNQSVAIWRAFHADLAACAPFLSSEEEEQLKSQYSQIRSRKDFDPILEKLTAIAKEHGLRIQGGNLW